MRPREEGIVPILQIEKWGLRVQKVAQDSIANSCPFLAKGGAMRSPSPVGGAGYVWCMCSSSLVPNLTMSHVQVTEPAPLDT